MAPNSCTSGVEEHVMTSQGLLTSNREGIELLKEELKVNIESMRENMKIVDAKIEAAIASKK